MIPIIPDDDTSDSFVDGPTEANDNVPTEASADAPENLIKKENRQAVASKSVLVLLLLGATIGTTWAVYKFTRNVERSNYKTTFAAVSSRLTNTVSTDLYLKFQIARSLAAAVESSLRDQDVLAYRMDHVLMYELTNAARTVLNFPLVGWSPIITSNADRLQFEAYASSQTIRKGAFPECYLCGDDQQTFGAPDETVFLPGLGVLNCREWEYTAMTGVFPPGLCPIAKNFAAQSKCQCTSLAEGEEVLSANVTKPDFIYTANVNDMEKSLIPYEMSNRTYLPTWQMYGIGVSGYAIMYDQMSEPARSEAIQEMVTTKCPTISAVFNSRDTYLAKYAGYTSELFSTLYYPLLDINHTLIGAMSMEILWTKFNSGIFPPDGDLVDIVVRSTCGPDYTFRIDSERNLMTLTGEGDLHETRFDDQKLSFEQFGLILRSSSRSRLPPNYKPRCEYVWDIYSSSRLEAKFITYNPFVYTMLTACIFVFTAIFFAIYDSVVNRRQSKVMESAKRTNDIVSTLFPEEIRSRMYAEANSGSGDGALKKMNSHLYETNQETSQLTSGPPIANLFPSATVMFLDIVEFTAWSSERDAWQAFKLLETLYSAFDRVAKIMGVFKIETIGDSYVCCCGLPKERADHVVIMAKFAKRCLRDMKRIVGSLEVDLGPLTGNLRARVGLHSGPVIAGVLRGEKARFQLFGDTANTAARMESTGKPHKIHASKATADLLIAAGKESWVERRNEDVAVKGKGYMETFFISPKFDSGLSSQHVSDRLMSDLDELSRRDELECDESGNMRLVDFNTEVLFDYLQKIHKGRSPGHVADVEGVKEAEAAVLKRAKHKCVIEELVQVVEMPPFVEAGQKYGKQDLPWNVKTQLRQFVVAVCERYRNVPFHNFAHCSHVIMSTTKLLNRIINPFGGDGKDAVATQQQIYDTTYGISGDPMMHFCALFAALIHDVDHTGLTNAELTNATTQTAVFYKGQSVAEQNSIDVSWALLMEPRFDALRGAIYTNPTEFFRFRQLIVQAVIATDISDKGLKTDREARWASAFGQDFGDLKSLRDRKATVVFDYLIQASDVCHMMQHWNVYQKFNRRLFRERFRAWQSGHMPKNPSEGWYGGELWFFDNYVIPTAYKLKACGVFGVTHNEFVAYATENRRAWETGGKSIVEELHRLCKRDTNVNNVMVVTNSGEAYGDEDTEFASDEVTEFAI